MCETTFADLTTLRLGGAPTAVLRCPTVESIVDNVRSLDAQKTPLLIVGGGSNLVVGDELDDLVAVVIEADEVTISRDGDDVVVFAEAGAVWDDVVKAAVAAGAGGMECLSGIPGSAGATPVQNVGAYGVEVAQILDSVQLFDRTTGKVEWVTPDALDLAYRYSNLKFTNRAVVLAVRYRLRADGLSAPLRYGELARRLGVSPTEAQAGEVRRPAARVREEVLALRRGKGMVLDAEDHDTWSAGSFFTNPIIDEAELADVHTRVVHHCGDDEADSMPVHPAGPGRVKLSAAWLIERAGFTKGYPGQGAPVRLSTKHTLALTNRGCGATTADLVALAREVRGGVASVFGVRLVPEPVWVGVDIDA
ncbi:UDP-N-acetylmuramate dehydrogenase [Corynebacterium sp. TAE3-ERU12]|uniref:UDP-N-acetylmuramate dehydrogenase n=1 Tax=Corynebacterium sp. TAE3-ERU12 TaxID=2849491 RepID=UPI001C4453F3|nr:UDP-N-acetylmuramate dehydrogenase [Corynebacterium sp. TAE3-ERU12]MBV7294527.1 UDP-N-acetylmuramate dehydrogenase [Corynebacterium sp. TAE3-ERU12]